MCLNNNIGVVKYKNDSKDSNNNNNSSDENNNSSNLIEVYHGSTDEIIAPDPTFNKTSYDYGKGFYLTRSDEDAKDWAIYNSKGKVQTVYVNKYKLDISGLNKFVYTDDLLFEELCSICYYMSDDLKQKAKEHKLFKSRLLTINKNINKGKEYFRNNYNKLFKFKATHLIIGNRIDSAYMTTLLSILANIIKLGNVKSLFSCRGYDYQICLLPSAYDRLEFCGAEPYKESYRYSELKKLEYKNYSNELLRSNGKTFSEEINERSKHV